MVDKESRTWLYINEDLSYNVRTITSINTPRTQLEEFEENNLKNYFEYWYAFYNNDKFDMIREMYFQANRNKDIWAEDIFI